MMLVLATIYLFLAIPIMGIIGCILSITTGTYDWDLVLKDVKEFFKCVFMYQVALYNATERYINNIGILILEVLVSALAFPLNILIFVILGTIMIIKGIAKLFYLAFRKKDEELDKSFHIELR